MPSAAHRVTACSNCIPQKAAVPARRRFSLPPGWKAADLGVTAFVIDARGATWQALAMPACP
jgi:hypothetical protein